MQSLAPNIFVKDISASIDFYKKLGFSVVMTVPEQQPDAINASELVWAMLVNGSVTFMFQTYASLGEDLPAISRQNGASLLLYINVADIQSLFDQVKDNVSLLKGLEKTFYGATEFSILDPNNYVLTFAQQ